MISDPTEFFSSLEQLPDPAMQAHAVEAWMQTTPSPRGGTLDNPVVNAWIVKHGTEWLALRGLHERSPT
jgi:hypothetical protein